MLEETNQLLQLDVAGRNDQPGLAFWRFILSGNVAYSLQGHRGQRGRYLNDRGPPVRAALRCARLYAPPTAHVCQLAHTWGIKVPGIHEREEPDADGLGSS